MCKTNCSTVKLLSTISYVYLHSRDHQDYPCEPQEESVGPSIKQINIMRMAHALQKAHKAYQ